MTDKKKNDGILARTKLSKEAGVIGSRRKFLGGLSTGTVAGLGAGVADGRWVKPVIESVVLPAHAQTTSPAVPVESTFTARLKIIENDTDNPAYREIVLGDGDHTIDGFDDTNDVDDPHFEFQAIFDPPRPIESPAQVTLNLTIDSDFDFGDIDTTETRPVVAQKSMVTLDADDGSNDGAEFTAVFTAPGYPTRTIHVVFTS